MPSTHKTEVLKLNQWTGEDKPKRGDWNADNLKTDTAFQQMEQNLSTHKSDSTAHVTSAERQKWGSGQSFSIASYTGSGEQSRSISLGVKPSFAIVFAANTPPTGAVPAIVANSGYLSGSGCSAGLALISTGFSVTNQLTADPNNFALRLNQSGVKYICVYWI